MKKLLLLFMILSGICAFSVNAFAWSQDTHENINHFALQIFHERALLSSKYELSPVQETLLFKGLKTVSASLQKKNYKDTVTYNTFDGWVIHGGYSADESNIYAGVRHFYDPLKLSKNISGERVSYLTDQVSLHSLSSLYEDGEIPEINALNWALDHKENPYNFKRAQKYYYMAMTISESEDVKGFDAEDLFRIRDIPADSLEEQRNLYLAAAFRGLGETMHMLADMTVPAHVRNDSHLSYDPLESRITGNEAQLYALYPVDSTVKNFFKKEDGISPYTLEEIFNMLSTYTNEHFYSDDTIYDENEDIFPGNAEANYPRPQFSELTKSSVMLKNGAEVKTWNGDFDGVQVPLASQSLISVVYEEEDNKYFVSPGNALEQGKILIPIAVAACAELVDRFLPTFELEAKTGDEHEMKDKKGNGYTGIELDVKLLHLYDKDPDWDADMEIRYSGPGKLIFIEDGEKIRERKVNFENGVISEIQVGREMKDQPLILYQKDSNKTKLSRDESQYEITDKTSVKIIVDAGARVILSDEINFDDRALKLEISYLPEKPVKADEIKFSADADSRSYFVWNFGDNNTEEGYDKLSVEHKYEKEGNYEVRLTCYPDDKKEKITEEGKTDISIGEKFDIKILPGNNLEAKAADMVEISAVPSESNRSFEGLTINWILDKATVIIPDNDKVQFQFNEAGRYVIIVQALDSNSVIVGEGKATIDITNEKKKLQITYPSEVGFLDVFAITLSIDEYTRKQLKGVLIKSAEFNMLQFCSDKSSYFENEDRFIYEGEADIVFYGKPRNFPNQDTKMGIDITLTLNDNSRIEYMLEIMIRDVTYEIDSPDSSDYDKTETHSIELFKADEGGSHEGTTIPFSWFYYNDMSDADGYSENFRAANIFVEYKSIRRYGDIFGKLDSETAKIHLLSNKPYLRIIKYDHLENVSEEKYAQGELSDSFVDINNYIYGFWAKSFEAVELKKSYNNPVKTQAGEQLYAVRMIKEYYLIIGEELFCVYTRFVENAPASQIESMYASLEAKCDSIARTFKIKTQATGEYITLD